MPERCQSATQEIQRRRLAARLKANAIAPPSRQLVIPLADAVQAQRKSDALFRGLEDDKRRGLGGAELAQKLVVHHHLGDAAIGQTSDKAGAADVLIVEFEAEPRRQQ